jgi:hypothetical protein
VHSGPVGRGGGRLAGLWPCRRLCGRSRSARGGKMEGMKGNSFDGMTWRRVTRFGHAAKIGASGLWSSSGTTFQAGKTMVSGGIEFWGRRPRRRTRQRRLL